MDRHRRAGRERRHAAAGKDQIVAAIQPPLLSVPATAAAARLRGPSQEQYFACLWSTAGRNRQHDAQVRGRRWFPLPAKARAVEGTFFVIGRGEKTGLDLADLLIKSLYEDDCNEVGDKRQELLHYMSRSPLPDDKGLGRLRQELSVLMGNVYKKMREILECTGYTTFLPHHFSQIPALQE